LASIISHPAIPLAIGVGLGTGIISKRLLVVGMLCSIAPDLDVYAEMFTSSIGHRGITHSIFFAAICAALATSVAPWLRSPALTAAGFIFAATASHGFLDAFTNGGSAVALLWPVQSEGFFMPYRVIEVSPLGISPFFSERGVAVLASELKWVWLPAVLLAAVLHAVRRLTAAANVQAHCPGDSTASDRSADS
jgi:inner membrane protein